MSPDSSQIATLDSRLRERQSCRWQRVGGQVAALRWGHAVHALPEMPCIRPREVKPWQALRRSGRTRSDFDWRLLQSAQLDMRATENSLPSCANIAAAQHGSSGSTPRRWVDTGSREGHLITEMSFNKNHG